MQFELVSPERSLASTEVESVSIPGNEGDMTAMAGHAALLTSLRPGLVVTNGASGAREYVVTGGFAEISGEHVTILAEQVYAGADVTAELMDTVVEHAESMLEDAIGSQRDAVEKHLADAIQLKHSLGF